MVAVCFNTCLHKVQSSAKKKKKKKKNIVLELRSSGKSFMKIKNSIGPNTGPCGTPLTTGTVSDDCSTTNTCCILELRKDEIHWYLGLTTSLGFKTMLTVIQAGTSYSVSRNLAWAVAYVLQWFERESM